MGILGAPLMGYYLDKGVDSDLREVPALHQKVAGPEKATMFGPSPSLDNLAVDSLEGEEKESFEAIRNSNKKNAFLRQSVLPAFLLLCYLILFFYFKSRGGYKPVEIGGGGGH